VAGFVTKMLNWTRILPSRVTPNSCNWNHSQNSSLWHCRKKIKLWTLKTTSQ